MSNDLRMWLVNEVKAACEAEDNAEVIAYYAAGSDRAGCRADWRRAKANAQVARMMLAEVLS